LKLKNKIFSPKNFW